MKTNRLQIAMLITLMGYTFIEANSAISLPLNAQTATLSSQFHNRTASGAVDGNNKTHADGCQCCAATSYELSPWLFVEFQQTFKVNRIEIYGRTDGQFQSQNLAGSNIHLNDVIVYTIPTSGDWVNYWDAQISPTRTASNIRITLPGNDKQLVICELVVYGDCPDGFFTKTTLCDTACNDGYFGVGCANRCHCTGTPCNKVTGVCPSGTCLPGYKGQTCASECDIGTFGQECTQKCHCQGGDCTKETGVCPSGGCLPGYIGITCSKECEVGRFGLNCNSSCGKCSGGDHCDIFTGLCPNGCSEGYLGGRCLQASDLSGGQASFISVPVFIGVISGCVLVVGAVGFGVAFMFYRKIQQLKPKQNYASDGKDQPVQMSNISSDYAELQVD